MWQRYKQVFILTAMNALAFSAMPMMMLVGSLVGSDLASHQSLATLPIALMVVGLAAGVVPVAAAMKRWGRKKALAVFMLVAIAACVLASFSLRWKNFEVFCSAAFILGFANAALQQVRFAAVETVDLKYASTAASWVMCGGILAAVIGPELALRGQNLLTAPYQASFLMVAACIAAALLVLYFYQPSLLPVEEKLVNSKTSIGNLLAKPEFILAVASGTVAYTVMTFLMTGTPISMHLHYQHSLIDTKWVIQSHIAAMFLPSLISPVFFKLLGIRGMMWLGLFCYVMVVAVGWFDTSVWGFWLQLVLLGIGWNFLFISGTALLATAYQASEKYTAQAFNDGVIFSIQAIASLLAGWVMGVISWPFALLLVLVPIVLMLALLFRPNQCLGGGNRH